MKIRKWVDMGAEVEVEIDVHDVAAALGECFSNVTDYRLGEERPRVHDILRAFNNIAVFFHAVTDEQIGMLNPAQRTLIEKFLFKEHGRFKDAAIARASAEGLK